MKILILSDYELPDKTASSSRAITFAKIFTELGHKVQLIGTNYSEDINIKGMYQGFEFINLGGKSEGNKITYRHNRIKKISKSMEKEVDKIYSDEGLDMIFLVGYIWDFHKTIKTISNKHNLKLVSDVVEWYDKKSFSGISGPVKYIQNRIGLMLLLKKNKNLVCISSLLENYYKDSCHVIRVPTILDMDLYEESDIKYNEKLVVSYAGMPRKKDKILNIIEAISMLEEHEQEKLEFRIFGPSVDDLRISGVTPELLEKTSKTIKCFGKIPNEDVVVELQKSDFTVLLRPDLRYANAGFPTKVGESLAAGIPVITNITSDLSMYLKNSENSLIVADDSTKECLKTLRKAMELEKESLTKMRKQSREDALRYFDYRNYLEGMQNFLEELR